MQNLDHIRDGQFKLNTIYGDKILGSIWVNRVLIPAASLQNCLNRFVSNLAVWTEYPNYKIRLMGSATGIAYRSFKYLIHTRHQIRNIEPEKCGIILPPREAYLSAAGYYYLFGSDQSGDDDKYDLIAHHFTDQANKIAGLSGRFFELSADCALEEHEHIVAYLAYGYPSADQRYEVDDENLSGLVKRVDLVSRSITCDPEQTDYTSPLGKCRLRSQEQFNMDGLSGGPVFASIASGGNMKVKFAGIVNRAGNGIIHFIKAKIIQNLLDSDLKNQSLTSTTQGLGIRDVVQPSYQRQ
jgi:hypothetical protein